MHIRGSASLLMLCKVRLIIGCRSPPFSLCGDRLEHLLQVYKGIWQGNTPVAVKFVTGHSPKEQQRFRNEVAILKSLRHVNIVQFLGASLAGDQIMLVTEYMPRGDLWRALSQDSVHHFAWRNM